MSGSRTIRKLLALALLAFTAGGCATGGLGDALGLSPYWDWKTIETEHFRVTFPVELKEIAEKSANYLEEAQAKMGPSLRWTPSHHVQILVIDNEDLANGLTSAEGRFGIVFFVTPPENWFSTSYYDDWLRLLAFHEYTHYLNMDTTRGVWKVGRYIFGDVLLPNSLWPSWMLEGLAVWDETRFTHGGRGRSPFYEMILRTAVDDHMLDDSRFITLDKVNGGNPYWPGGETAYLFGYQLMNQVASTAGQSALGTMSWKSGGRFPYLINGNLENITGRDWYDYWDDFVRDTRRREGESIARIKKYPLTHVDLITSGSYEVLGNAASSDGKWLAFTQQTLEQITGLYLKNLETGAIRRLEDKLLGIGMAFTPDSRHLIYSDLHKQNEYYLRNDLRAYDLQTGARYWITDALRARDPDVSRDGKWLTFTVIEHGKTDVALAPLSNEGGRLHVGKVEKLYSSALYDNVSNPKFSPDGRRVVFSIHRNGHSSEDLMAADLATRKGTTLLANGSYNRFPAFNPEGSLYYVSDASGVDNLYRLSEGVRAEQMTNVISGIWFPSFGPHGKLYASYYTNTGWDLAQVHLPESASERVSTSAVKVDPAPAPKMDEKSSSSAKDVNFPVDDYTPWATLLPRGWLPYLTTTTGNGVYVGGYLTGFDATDRHRYLLGGGYYTGLGVPDFQGLYQNRSFGPTLSFYSAYTVSNLGADVVGSTVTPNTYTYSRNLDATVSAAFPILFTYSALIPAVAWNAQRTFYYNQKVSNGITGGTWFVPSADATLTFTDALESRLAISPETGRTTRVGSRVYFDGSQQTWKGLVSDVEYIRAFGHTVLVPSVNASYVTRRSTTFLDANVAVQGREPAPFSSFPGVGFTRLPIRGYPFYTYYTKAASTFALDYRFPLLDIYRGWGTNPAFLNDLYGFTFAEATYFPDGDIGAKTLPSAGGGVRANLDLLLNFPLILSVEYHKGFYTQLGGVGEVFFQAGIGAISF